MIFIEKEHMLKKIFSERMHELGVKSWHASFLFLF
jgi:hypothetical protein